MSSHVFNYDRGSLDHRTRDLNFTVTIGATGAPTLVKTKSKGIQSITRTSAGLYVLTLDDAYVRLLCCYVNFRLAAGSFPAAPHVQIAATTVGAASRPTITIQCANTTGTIAATDPASGEEMCGVIFLCDSTAF